METDSVGLMIEQERKKKERCNLQYFAVRLDSTDRITYTGALEEGEGEEEEE